MSVGLRKIVLLCVGVCCHVLAGCVGVCRHVSAGCFFVSIYVD